MGQKKPIETDLPEADFEDFLAMADAEGLPPDELFAVLIQEGLEQTRVKTSSVVVLPFAARKPP